MMLLYGSMTPPDDRDRAAWKAAYHRYRKKKKSLAIRNFPSSCDWEVGCAAEQFWPFPLVRAQQVHTLKVSIRHRTAL